MSRRPAHVVVYGPKVRAARERADLSQAQLAERLGFDQSTVSRWELGPRLLVPSVADRLAEVLGVKPKSLLDTRDCAWCGEPQSSPSNPLVFIRGAQWVHRVQCFDALARRDAMETAQ